MKCMIPLELIDIEGEGYHLSLDIRINGKKARMVLDTGASRTVFDSNSLGDFIEEPQPSEEEKLSTGVGSNTLKSFSIVFEEFELAELKIKNYAVAVLDLQHITSSYSQIGKGNVHGVLGGDILYKYKAVIDYDGLKLHLEG